jgi:DNA topoisomerase IA
LALNNLLDALNKPEAGQATGYTGSTGHHIPAHSNQAIDSMGHCNNGWHHSDEIKLPNLYSHVEGKQCEWNFTLQRQGLLERTVDNSYLATDADNEDPMNPAGHAITYRIEVGPQTGRKVFAETVINALIKQAHKLPAELYRSQVSDLR